MNKEDTVYRQAAIDGILSYMPVELKRGATTSEQAVDQIVNSIWRTAIHCAESYVRNMPSADPERKKGEWIRNDNGTYSCSVCRSWIPGEQHHYARYCLYCGAEMKGEKDEGSEILTGGNA